MAEPYTGEYSSAEYMAILVSRHIRPDDNIVGPGFYADIIYNGAMLAMLTHAPEVLFLSGVGWCSILERELPRSCPTFLPFEYRFFPVTDRTLSSHDYQLCNQGPRRIANVFFLGGLQVDRYGNQNTSLIGDPKKPTLRGPGIIGLNTFSLFMDRYYIFTRGHDRRTFVNEVEYISAPGYKNKYGDRKGLGLARRNSGPSGVITPLALMDFEEKSKQMRLKSVHPGHTVEEVRDNTGLDLIVPDGPGKVPTTEPPTIEEITLLRTQIDRLGVLREPF